jgi:hypothetical protein
MRMRRCGRCNHHLPLAAFAWRRATKGQRDNYCYACRAAYKREHYLENRDRYIENAGARRRAEVHRRTVALLDYLAEHPCQDCGEDDPVVLEFDHRGDKEFDISRGLRDRAWPTVLQEIAKCDVVCANCHRRRTACRGGFLRASLLTNVTGPNARA